MKNKILDYSPEKVLMKLWNSIFPNEYKRESIVVFSTSIVTAFLCYFMLMVTGYAGPDGVIEGVYMYQGGGWAISIGRWFIAYSQRYLVFNAVVPFLIVIMYCTLIAFGSMCVFRMFGIRNVISQILLSAIFVSFPVVTLQFGFLYMAVYYALSFFCVALGVLLIRKRNVQGYIFATICFVVMLGSYQTYIAEAAVLAIMLLIFDTLDERKKKETFCDFGGIVVVGAIASVLDLLIMKAAMSLEGVDAASKIDGFSLNDIIENFGFSFKYAVKWFFSYFKDERMSRDIIYIVVIGAIVCVLLLHIIDLIRGKRFADAIIITVSIYLIPHMMNLFQYLFPHNGIYDIMRYQYVLIFAMLVVLIDKLSMPIPTIIVQWIAYISMCLLLVTYTASANVAGLVYKVVYTETYTEASMMMNRVYALDGYKRGETKVVLANPIDWQSTRDAFGLLRSETSIGAGPVFWPGFAGLNDNRRNYFLNYLGIEVGLISESTYNSILNSDEYEEMSYWPAEGSVKMINGYAVIKNE